MKLDEMRIGTVYFNTPLNLGGSRLSVSANDARFTPVPGLGVLVESRGPDRQTTLVPWSSVDRMEVGGASLDLPPSPRVAAPPPPPAEPPPAPRREPEISLHERQAQAALEERKRLAEERAAQAAPKKPGDE